MRREARDEAQSGRAHARGAAEPHAVAALHAVRRWSPAFASQAGDSWELARVACPELYSCAGFEGIARLAQKHGAAALRALERANCFGDGHKRGAYAWLPTSVAVVECFQLSAPSTMFFLKVAERSKSAFAEE